MSATDATRFAERNGHDPDHNVDEPGADGKGKSGGGLGVPGLGLIGKVGKRLAGAVTSRIPPADLDAPGPAGPPPAALDEPARAYTRETLPRLWLAASLYFRGEVRGLGNIPEEGPVLLVGNHSGGNVTPDTGIFTLAFATYFGVERAFYQLAHNLVLSMPGLGF